MKFGEIVDNFVVNYLSIITRLFKGETSPPEEVGLPSATEGARVETPTTQTCLKTRTDEVPAHPEILDKDDRTSAVVKRIISAIQEKKPVTLIHGRAGTGKTTLIRRIIDEAKLNYVILAPTGVAALNAGGQTIHSFFRLPPRMINLDDIEVNNQLKTIVRRLEFLVIDEISMVRADVLDAIDHSLRMHRASDEAFGGIPMILVGDFLQLPPIVETADAEILRHRGYELNFAFAAKCMQDLNPSIVELTTVYRQREASFIELLGKLRVGEDVHEVVAALNQLCHRPHRQSATPVTLTARINSAEQHNFRGLASLPGTVTTYTGTLVGEFARKSKERLPAPEFLDLKVGARVMLAKNDSSKRWVNGSLGTITQLAPDYVSVRLDEDAMEYDVTRETWESVKYEWDHSGRRIVANVVGKYSQMPLVPAWAITVHKAQGLTLSDVRIDLSGGAFSEGQTYVALSRAKSIEGLSFVKSLSVGDVRVDPSLVAGVRHFSAKSLA